MLITSYGGLCNQILDYIKKFHSFEWVTVLFLPRLTICIKRKLLVNQLPPTEVYVIKYLIT